MLTIRPYQENDAQSAGVLIADTYSQFNLSELPGAQHDEMPGPFLHERSAETSHRKAIVDAVRVPMAQSQNQNVPEVFGFRDARLIFPAFFTSPQTQS
jgi:hypothetical protein